MPNSLGMPDPSDYPLISTGPDPSSAGAGWAAMKSGLDQAANVFGGFQQMAETHEATVHAAQDTSIRTNIEAQQSTLAAAHANDAAGFAAAAGEAKNAFIKTLPGRYAINAGRYWDDRATAIQATVAVQGMQRSQQLAVDGLNIRDKQLSASRTSTFESGAPLADAWQSPVVQQGLEEQAQIRQQLVAAKAISPEEAALRAQTDRQADLAAAFSGHVTRVFQTQGATAALDEVDRLAKQPVPGAPADPNAWESSQPLTDVERNLMAAKGRNAVNLAISAAQERTNAAQAQQLTTQNALQARAQAEADFVLHNGKNSGAGPTDADWQQAYPTSWAEKLTAYRDTLTKAGTQHQDDGITPGMTSEEIAQHAANRAALKPLDTDLGTPEKLATLKLAMRGAEGGIRPDGTPILNSAGAAGGSQILLSTAQAVARAHGMNSFLALSPAQQQAELLKPDQTTNAQLGDALIEDLAKTYGDPRLVAYAYHNGASYGPDGKATSAPLEHAFVTIGRPDVNLPFDQWLQKMRTLPVPGSPHGSPQGVDYVLNVADRMNQAQKVAAAQSTIQRAQEITTAAVNDPLGFGATHGWGQPPPLSLSAYDQPGAPQARFAQQLQARLQSGQALVQAHPSVPLRLLTSAEADFYRQAVSKDPAAGVRLATAAATALGPVGAKALLGEVGQSDLYSSVGVHAGILAASGPVGMRVADSVTDGLDQQSKGMQEPKLPPGQTWQRLTADVGPAFRLMPDALATTLKVAQLSRLGAAGRGQADTPDAHFRAALGGWKSPSGVAYGGVAPVNGQPVIHPEWMRVGTMPAALRALGDGGQLGADPPVFANGQPLRGKDMAGLVPVAQPDNTYRFLNPRSGAWVAAKSGRPYAISFDAAKPFLSHTPGDIVGIPVR